MGWPVRPPWPGVVVAIAAVVVSSIGGSKSRNTRRRRRRIRRVGAVRVSAPFHGIPKNCHNYTSNTRACVTTRVSEPTPQITMPALGKGRLGHKRARPVTSRRNLATQIYAQMHIHTHTYTYIHMHTHTYTNIHTCIHTLIHDIHTVGYGSAKQYYNYADGFGFS